MPMPVSLDGEGDGQLAVVGVVAVHLQPDLAPLGELGGVAQQVDQHLPEAQRVADELPRQPGCTSTRKRRPFPRPVGDHRDEAVEHLVEEKRVASMPSRPASILEKSRMSLTMPSRLAAEVWIFRGSRAGGARARRPG
jgi:hypothetical protein